MHTYRRYYFSPRPQVVAFPSQSEQFQPDKLEKTLKGLGYDKDLCRQIEQEIDRLFEGYSFEVFFGARHRAPCPVWRSERVIHIEKTLGSELPEPPRFANRVFVFAGSANQDEGELRRTGRFVGYLSLRPHILEAEGAKDPGIDHNFVSVAYLQIPHYMQRPGYHVITTVVGPPDGIMPFRSTPYCGTYGGDGNRAVCLHCALHAGLLLKANSFRCVPVSSQDMLAIHWKNLNGEQPSLSMEAILEKGLTLYEALKVVRSPEVRAGGVVESLNSQMEAPELGEASVEEGLKPLFARATRTVTDYLTNGLPVIFSLRAEKDDADHSALVVGMRYSGDSESDGSWTSPGRFIVHDIAFAPFHERNVDQVMLQALYPVKGQKDIKSHLSFLALGPPDMKVGALDVRDATEKLVHEYCDNDSGFHKYQERAGNPGMKLDTAHISLRMCECQEIYFRYFSKKGPGDYGVAIDKEKRDKETVFNLLKAGGCKLFWCSELRAFSKDLRPISGTPFLVFIWPINDPETLKEKGPLAVLRLNLGTEDKVKLEFHAGNFEEFELEPVLNTKLVEEEARADDEAQ